MENIIIQFFNFVKIDLQFQNIEAVIDKFVIGSKVIVLFTPDPEQIVPITTPKNEVRIIFYHNSIQYLGSGFAVRQNITNNVSVVELALSLSIIENKTHELVE